MQHTFFGLLTAILTLKGPYLTLDRWMQCSPHKVGLPAAVRASDRLNGGRPHIAELFQWQMSHGEPPLSLANKGSPGLSATDVTQAKEKKLTLRMPERLSAIGRLDINNSEKCDRPGGAR